MKQLIKFFVLFLFIPPILSGCWNSRELDDLSISNAIGVDKINGEYMFTTQIINPSELSKDVAGKRTVITTIDETGETIFQAWRKLTTESKSKLYFSHVRVLVIGEETAREGISEILDVLLRDHDFRSDFLLVVAKDHTANDVLSVLTTLNVIPGDKMFESLDSSSEHYGTTSEIPLDKFITDLMSKGKNPITTGVLITGKVEEGRYTSKYEDIKPEVTLKYGTLGAFKDDQLIGWMTEEQSRGYNFAVGNIKSTLLNTPCVDGEGVMGIEVIRTKAKMSAQQKNGQIQGKIHVKVVGNMMDSECETPQKTDDPKVIEKLQQNVNKTIEEEIKSAVEIDQKSFKADLLGFGDAYHRNNPKDWKVIQSKWFDIYPDIPIMVTVETEIHNAGSIILSPKAEVEK